MHNGAESIEKAGRGVGIMPAPKSAYLGSSILSNLAHAVAAAFLARFVN